MTKKQSFIKTLLAIAAIAFTAFVHAAGPPRIVPNHGTYVANEDISIAFTNGPSNAKDWIGLYAVDGAPGPTPSLKYLYVDNTTSGATAKADGTVTFAGGLPVGIYFAYFLANDGYQILAKVPFQVIEAAAPLVRADKSVYRQGENIQVAFSRGPGNAKDWIGVYYEGVPPGAGSVVYKYVDDTPDGNTAKTDGTVTFPGGIVIPGRFTAYLFVDDSYDPVAQETFEIALTSTPIVTITPDHEKYHPGQPIKIAFEGGPGNKPDWIGVYEPDDRPGPVPSTIWRYLNGSDTVPQNGISDGEITFPDGLATPMVWRAFFLLNDGYAIAGQSGFEVLDAAAPLVQTDKRVYDVNQAITVNFTNGPANAKDWIALYSKGLIPRSGSPSILWFYVDGTDSGAQGVAQGSIVFPTGLSEGEYTAYLLENDGYTALASESFSVKASGVQSLRLLSLSPADGAVNASAAPDFTAVIENRDTTLNAGSVVVTFDGAVVQHAATLDGATTTIKAAAPNVLAQGSQHTFRITYNDNTGANFASQAQFTVGEVVQLTLPPPLFFENFDTTEEGSLPSNWTASNQSDSLDLPADLGHLGSISYNNFTVVSAARLGGDFLTYTATPEVRPIAQILGPGKANYVVNGSLVREFAANKAIIGVSGYHGGDNQVLEVLTPVIQLNNAHNLYLSFHSLLEQNQDSIAGIEMTTDGGTTWTPVVYYLDPSDIVVSDSVIDVDATFTTPRGDIAVGRDAVGGTYGAFLKAPINAAASAAIQGRGNDDPVDGTRVEYIRLAAADGMASAQFRIFYAGTDSWYFGFDNFGVYSQGAEQEARITVTRTGGDTFTLSWPALPGYKLQSSSLLTPGSWSDVSGVTGTTYNGSASANYLFYRLIKPQ